MQDDTRLFRPTRAALAAVLIFQALCPGLLAAPAITATKDDGLAAGAKKPAGSTVTYTNTITNGTGAGITDATGVQFADPDVANATYAPNTLTATPVAVDDTYPSTVIANTSINTATGGFSVVANDFAGYSAGTAVLTTALTITNVVTPLHGTLVMTLSGAGVGQFIYTPTAGYSGADSFTYTISNSVTGGTAVSRTATANLTVGGPVIWFVNPNLASNGTGILGNPFNNLAAAVTAIGTNTNQRVFIYSGGADQTTATPLNSGAWLVGQAAAGTTFEALMGGISYPSDTTAVRPSINNATKPKLTRTGGNTVTLGENNVILGLAIGNTGGGYTVLGNNINAVQIGNAATSDVDLSSGSSSTGALSLTGGTGNITVNALIATTAGRSVSIVNRAAGILSFPKAISDTGTGINLTTNNAATISFTGGLGLSTGANTAFNATGGGTITVTQNNTSIVNTLATTSGIALNVANTTIGASGITFRSITAGTVAGTAGVGISLNTTGGSGGLTVTGNGTAGSGGTIQRKTGPDSITSAGIGIYLNSTSNVSLARMQLNDFDNFAIRGTNVIGFTLGNSVINSAGGSSWNGTNDAGGFNEGSVSFSELTGSASISNTSISGGFADNVRVLNTTGTLNRITFDTVTIGANHSGAALDGSLDRGNDGIILEALTGSAVLNATVQNSTFTSSRGDLIQFSNNGVAANDLVFTGNHLSNNYPRIATGGGGVSLFSNGTGNLTLNLTGNDFRDSVGTAVLIVKSTGAATLAGTISNNTIGVFGVANSGSREGSALKIQSAGGGTVTTSITNNLIRQYNNNGIELLTGGGATAQGGNFNSTITGNTITNPGNNPATAAIAKNGIHLNGGTVPLDSYLISLDIGGAGSLANSLSGSGAPNDVPAGGEDIRLRQRQDTRVQLRGYTGTPADNAAVQAYSIARNGGDGAPSGIASNNVSTATDGYFNTPGPGGPVTQPLIFATGGIEKSSDPVIQPASSLEVAAVTNSPAIQAVVRAAQIATPDIISQQQLDSTVAAAISRWEATGLTGEQLAVLRGVKFEVSTLGDNHLGEASANLIRVDGNAGGNGWFVDASSQSDDLFGTVAAVTRLHTEPTAAPAGRMDLLTTILHEMGHALGLADTYSIRDRDSIMYGQLTKGERRLPAHDQAKHAQPFPGNVTHFLSGTLNPITIGTLPPGKSVVITYDVTINDPFTLGATQISSQGTVSGSNFTTVNGTVSTSVPNTDDATVAGASDPTVTLLDRPDTTVATIARASGSPTNANPVSWTVTFANATAGLTSGNFSLTSTGLGGTPAISSVAPTGAAPAAVWTVTASTGTGDGTLGLNLANDTALSHDVTNQPFTGQVYTIDRTGPGATIVLADSALKIGETSLVTITFTEPASGFDNADLSVPNGTLSAVSTSDNITWTATLTPALSVSDPSNVITLGKAGVTDALGNAGTGNAVSANYAVDTASATVGILVTDTALKIGETSLVTFTFSEPVSDFSNADLTIANGALSAVTSGDSITWTATLTPAASVTDATNLITLANTGVNDLAGNPGTATTDSNNYAIDTVRPTATILVADNSLTAGETSLVTLTFSEPVSGFTNADLTIANGTLSAVNSGDSITWTATLTPAAGVTDTTNLITLNNTGLTDVAGNTGSGTTDSNNYAIDTTRPTATIVVADNALIVGETSLVTITFNEAISGLTTGDLTVGNGALTGLSTGDSITWTATLTPTASVTDATNLITLDNTGVQDTAGNTGTATTSSNNYAIDTARPTVTIVVADNNLTIGETSPVTITFSEVVAGFTNADLTVANGTLSAVTSGDGGVTWTATLTPTPNVTDATNVITLDNTGVTDAAGNTGTGTTDSNNYAVTSLSISIAANAASIAEGTGAGTTAFTFTVSRTGSTAGAVTMNFAVTGAANPADFGGTLPSGVFTIPDTQASAVLTINVSKDTTVEPDELFTVTLSSASGGYAITNATAGSAINNDDTAGYSVVESGGTSVSEPATTDTFTVVLNAQPLADVVFEVSSNDTAESTVSAGALTFTPANWNVAQTVTVTAADDVLVDGSQNSTITITINDAASDNAFDALADQTVSVTTADNDIAGFTLVQSGGTTAVGEPATTDSFTVVLNAQPLTDVVLGVSSNDTTEATVSTSALTFTTSNWNVAQIITATAADDLIVDGPQNSTITVTVNDATSDNAFDLIADQAVSVTTADNDIAGFTIVQTGGTTAVTENSATDSFTVVLTAQPLSNVVLGVSSGDTTEATVSTAALTFTSANWNVAQTVTVAPADDLLVDGTITSAITVAVTDAASDNAFDPVADQSVSVSTADDDLASVMIAQSGTGITAVSEPATTNSLSVVLGAQPLTNVVLNVTSGDTTEATVSTSALTFTTANWNVAQTVTITAADDVLVDGSVASTITVSVNDAASDNAFDPLADQTVAVTTADNDVAGFAIVQSGGSTAVTEPNTTDSFTVVLTAQPVGNVVFNVSSNDTTESTVPSGSLTFTTSNWNVAQMVTVSAADDFLVDGGIASTVTVAVNDAISDNAFDPLADQTVAVSTADNDVPGFAILQSGGSTAVTEPNTTDTFTVVLTAQPLTSVAFTVSSSDTTASTVSPPALTFTNANWNVAQNVTVTAANDTQVDGSQSSTITVAVNDASSDNTFDSLADQTVSVTTADEDVLTLSVTATDANADENSAATGTWRVSRNTVIGSTTVQLAIDSSSTASATDWTQTGATFSSLAAGSTGTAVIPTGQNFVDIILTPTADLHAEAAETARLNIAAAAAYTIGSPADATVSIGQNDFLVINTNDAGEGTLRQAVLNANAIDGTDTLVFDTTVFGITPRTIELVSQLPVISTPIIIPGPGAALLTLRRPDTASAFGILQVSSGGNLDLYGITITGGNARDGSALGTHGGGINNSGGDLKVTNSVITENFARGAGGGIYNNIGTVTVTNSTISGNSAGLLGGGGIYNRGGSLTVVNSTLTQNHSTAGGGILNNGGVLTVGNSTISGNHASRGGGGGLLNLRAPDAGAASPAFSGNSANTAGLGVLNDSSFSTNLSNTIVADNTAEFSPDVDGALSSQGYNLIGDGSGATGTATSDLVGTSTTPIVPKLGPLADNGGPTQTMALLNGSPAINGGLNANIPTGLTTDQRGIGFPRIFATTVDIGAFEVFVVKPTFTVIQPIKKNIKINRRSGLFDVIVKVTNTTPFPVNGFRLHVDFSKYKAAYPTLRLQNASSPRNSKDVYVDYGKPVAVDGTVTLKLSFYTRDRKFPKLFKPIYTVESFMPTVAPISLAVSKTFATQSSSSALSWLGNNSLSILPTIPATSPRASVMPDRTVQLEFPAIAGHWYCVSYTSDLIRWVDCPTPVQASGATLYWTDSGMPNTATHPAGEPTRFYRIHEVTAP